MNKSIVAALALLAMGGPAMAGVVTYSDRASFQAAAGALTTIDFNDQVVPPATFTGYGTTTTLSGVTFTGSGGTVFAVSPDYSPGYGLGDGVVLSWQFVDPNMLTIDLPAGTKAVGLDFGAFGAVPFTFALSSGDIFTVNGDVAPTATFFGFVSDTPIASLAITARDSAPQIDQFQFGAAAVPEPSSFALGLSGCVLLAWRYSRTSRTRSTSRLAS